MSNPVKRTNSNSTFISTKLGPQNFCQGKCFSITLFIKEGLKRWLSGKNAILAVVVDFSGISCSSESQNMKNAWGPNNKKICLKRSRAQLSIEKESWKGKLGNNMSKDRPYKGLQR